MKTGPLRASLQAGESSLLAFILLGSLLLNALPLWWGLPGGVSWAEDEIRPNQARASYAWPEKYPPLHRHVLKALYFPVLLLQQWGVLGLGDFELYTLLFALGRCSSVLLATATVYLVYRCGRELQGRLASCFAALVVALLPPFVYYAKTVNLEAPYIFWFTLSVLFFLRILRRHRMRDYIVFAASAAFAICTKDQAYGFYLASPLPIVASLAAARGGVTKAFFSAMLDRRVLAMGAVAVSCFLLIHEIPWNPESFGRHVEAITGPASASYRIYPMTLEGHAEMGAQSLEHIAFTLGWPFLAATLGGLGMALRQRRVRRLSALLLLAATYYASFISVIGYNYVRFFIPLCILLAIPAGAALAGLVKRRGSVAMLGRGLVGAAVLYALLRAVSVDLWMFGDARYDVEKWLEARGSRQAALGVGVRKRLPRIPAVMLWQSLGFNECKVLNDLSPRFVVIHPAAPRDPRIFKRFMAGELSYRLAEEWRPRPWDMALDISGVLTNLDKIARRMMIFEKIDGDCIDLAIAAEWIEELRHHDDPRRRARLIRAILDEGLAARTILEDEQMVALGLNLDGWTAGGSPAGVAVRNPWDRELTPLLTVRVGGRATATIQVDDGSGTVSYSQKMRGGRQIALTPVPPGSERLFIIWSDEEWTTDGPRRLGLRIKSGSWSEPEFALHLAGDASVGE